MTEEVGGEWILPGRLPIFVDRFLVCESNGRIRYRDREDRDPRGTEIFLSHGTNETQAKSISKGPGLSVIRLSPECVRVIDFASKRENVTPFEIKGAFIDADMLDEDRIAVFSSASRGEISLFDAKTSNIIGPVSIPNLLSNELASCMNIFHGKILDAKIIFGTNMGRVIISDIYGRLRSLALIKNKSAISRLKCLDEKHGVFAVFNGLGTVTHFYSIRDNILLESPIDFKFSIGDKLLKDVFLIPERKIVIYSFPGGHAELLTSDPNQRNVNRVFDFPEAKGHAHDVPEFAYHRDFGLVCSVGNRLHRYKFKDSVLSQEDAEMNFFMRILLNRQSMTRPAEQRPRREDPLRGTANHAISGNSDRRERFNRLQHHMRLAAKTPEDK